ncbi:Piezo (component of mechanically activated cation channel) [Dorcoceras hygrometricum]|uniref:Piezo (Component of mechanically activated cation channel) n=1 Tax=Dorcoceras hygrometricum TaxID=472368 RepID=A0A2Z7D2K1_9LAMI|nr:Piezo (component of mechanically activated cation channel) [Dorcoceras hygrometricum]
MLEDSRGKCSDLSIRQRWLLAFGFGTSPVLSPGSWFEVDRSGSGISALIGQQICFCRSGSSFGYHGFTAGHGVDPAGSAPGGG